MHPYRDLNSKAFWAKAVAEKNFLEISELWDPKWKIQQAEKIATFGSCFAQHIGNALKANGYTWFDAEPPPERFSEKGSRTYNYGVFSSRTGNIYTTSLLRQWTEWSLGKKEVPEEVWVADDRSYDPFRPAIEPNGFSSRKEMLLSRDATLEGFRRCISESSYFVFTLGLTESWFSVSGGHEYPMCPGTSAGIFDANDHVFRNQNYVEVLDNLQASMDMMRAINRDLRFLLTVSPVPLTATNSGEHVLTATTYSKSVLRAVAGELSTTLPYVDYFPSYEIISSPPYRGGFYEANQRGVVYGGVQHVMKQFFDCLYGKYPELNRTQVQAMRVSAEKASNQDSVCEEEILGAFGAKGD